MGKLLIIDDEPATVDMISTFLEINGYEPIGAYNGTDGLVLLEVERPDMVVVDLMMPDIEGFEVCRQTREKAAFAKTPILVISARTDQQAIERAYSSGANGYMTKPLNLPQFLGEITRLMENGATAAPGAEEPAKPNADPPASPTPSTPPAPSVPPAPPSA